MDKVRKKKLYSISAASLNSLEKNLTRVTSLPHGECINFICPTKTRALIPFQLNSSEYPVAFCSVLGKSKIRSVVVTGQSKWTSIPDTGMV